jgi:hypothetical protein
VELGGDLLPAHTSSAHLSDPGLLCLWLGGLILLSRLLDAAINRDRATAKLGGDLRLRQPLGVEAQDFCGIYRAETPLEARLCADQINKALVVDLRAQRR